jgi:uracil-DNA glycosylase family 4
MEQPSAEKALQFDELIAEVKACTKCARMEGSERVIGHACGTVTARIVFIGEAPGRLGADSSSIPFHGDQAGHNFETLIEQVGVTRYETFVTNAVLCNPKDTFGNNSPPTKEEIENCAGFLRRQIDLVQPTIVVTLGATALRATDLIERHRLQLTRAVRTTHAWYGRRLLPVYHPGQRATVHRSFANQLADYQFVAEQLRRTGTYRARTPSGASSGKVTSIVDYITMLQPQVRYFSLHKLFFLIEVEALKRTGDRMTKSYIVRQKDGPYCVDLHIAKIKKALPILKIETRGGKLTLVRQSQGLFSNESNSIPLDAKDKEVVQDIVRRYGTLSDFELKRRAYLTTEMRRVLRLERLHRVNMLNAALLAP